MCSMAIKNKHQELYPNHVYASRPKRNKLKPIISSELLPGPNKGQVSPTLLVLKKTSTGDFACKKKQEFHTQESRPLNFYEFENFF